MFEIQYVHATIPKRLQETHAHNLSVHDPAVSQCADTISAVTLDNWWRTWMQSNRPMYIASSDQQKCTHIWSRQL